MNYDKENIFAKILNNQIPCNKIYEDASVLSFYDINPRAKVHALVIPKGEFCNFEDFIKNSSQVSDFFLKVRHIAVEVLKLESFRLITNNGAGAGQEVMHFHVHILSY